MRKLLLGLILVILPQYAFSDNWAAQCENDELTDKVLLHFLSPVADTVRKAPFPYSSVDTRLGITMFPNGERQTYIWATEINLAGGDITTSGTFYYDIKMKFSPYDKPETFKMQDTGIGIGSNILLFTHNERAYNRMLNNDSLLVELPYFGGSGRYRYNWDKNQLANLIQKEKPACFK